MIANLARRALLAALPCAGMAALAPRLALATTQARYDKRLIVVILRGAMDGLSAVAPVGDPDYATLRGPLAIAAPGLTHGGTGLNRLFALHPSLAPLHPLYLAREMLVVHAMASPYRDHSHFEAQAVMENGSISTSGAADGWLNRFLVLMRATNWGDTGFAFGSGVPLTLQGAAAVNNWCPNPERMAGNVMLLSTAAMYAADPALRDALIAGLNSAALASTATPGVSPLSAFAKLAQSAGQIMAADSGPNVATIEANGWDTHIHQGGASGALADLLAALAEGVLLLKQGLGARWAQTAVVVITEFGRAAVPNGTGGTDHGTASAGFAFGGAVAGGRVLANWPGLSRGALYQGRDLAPTLDMRSFLKGIVGDHFRLPAGSLRTVFPGSGAAPALGGLIRA